MRKAYTVWKCKLTARPGNETETTGENETRACLLPLTSTNQLYHVFRDRFNGNRRRNTLLIYNLLRGVKVI